jgi:hypothetical protein
LFDVLLSILGKLWHFWIFFGDGGKFYVGDFFALNRFNEGMLSIKVCYHQNSHPYA